MMKISLTRIMQNITFFQNNYLLAMIIFLFVHLLFLKLLILNLKGDFVQSFVFCVADL